ncbi:MAG: helix-turn-helix domain-containing protein [Anaerolineae bacterium]|nr:helix-turn-helix domain-containing protein [Anaerolineae bacterium]
MKRVRQPTVSGKNITSVKLTANDLPVGETDWDALDTLNDEDVEQAALNDPDVPPTSTEALAHFRQAVDVKAIREKLSLTQAQFATTFHLSLGTIQAWEKGETIPDPVARTLLRVIERNPEAVKDALTVG